MTLQEVAATVMREPTTPAGAMPVAVGAMPAQSHPSGPAFAAYRLPRPGAPGAREVGVCFDGEPAGGANPPPPAPPPNPAAGDPPPTPPPPATGDPADLGDAGKRAIEAERAEAATQKAAARAATKRADEAERALEALKLAGASESEKAIAAAKKEGADGVIERVHATVRRSAVREALATAGALPSLIADLAKADEFAELKVNDSDELDAKDLAEAIKAHKARVPDAYKAQATPGSADGGTRSGDKEPAKTLEAAVAGHYTKD